jgi:hypothetical protein
MAISTSQSEHGMGATAWPRSLAWVACQAATELDNLLLGRAVSIDAVKGLSSALSASVAVGTGAAAPASLIDPTTTVVLTRALRDSDPQLTGKNLDDLVRVTVHLVDQLRQAAEPANARTTDDLNTLRGLRAFCLAVSRHAAAASPAPANRPEHPFRR